MVRTETVFCVPYGHPLAGSGRVDIREISGEPLIMFQEGFYQNEFVKMCIRDSAYYHHRLK